MSRATKSYKHVGVSHVREKSCDTFHFQTVGGANFGTTKPPDDRGVTLFRAGICFLHARDGVFKRAVGNINFFLLKKKFT